MSSDRIILLKATKSNSEFTHEWFTTKLKTKRKTKAEPTATSFGSVRLTYFI